jgi:hypothetical protein
MKTNYTVPTLSSLKDNAVKNLFQIEKCKSETRLLHLTGIPIRLRIDADYVELTSKQKVDLSAYNSIFEKLMSFFYGIGYVYGFVDNNILTVYDVYTNDNYFSSRDLKILSEKTGLPIATPIIEGQLTFDNILHVSEILIKEKHFSADDLFLLPSVYIDYTITFVSPKEESTVIFGEKKPTTYNYNNNYYYNDYWKNYYNKEFPKINETVKTTETTLEPVDEENATPTEKALYFADREVMKITTKEERTSRFKEVIKNVTEYSSKTKFFDQEKIWWKKYGISLGYLFAIYTLPASRKLLYEYAENFYISTFFHQYQRDEIWADLFLDFLSNYYSENKKIKSALSQAWTDDYFLAFFREELKALDELYTAERDPKNTDWRLYK